MFILFGWGKKTTKDYGETYPIKCSNCNNDIYSKLVNIKTWFTLFFIPIIPYSSKYYLLCNICSSGIELKGESVEKAKSLNNSTKSYFDKNISKEKYDEILAGFSF